MKKEFYTKLTRDFLILGLNVSNWKADTMATARYLSWKQTHMVNVGDNAETSKH